MLDFKGQERKIYKIILRGEKHKRKGEVEGACSVIYWPKAGEKNVGNSK
jgi:hypothetical protein